MPEFIMPTGATAREFFALPNMVQGYIEAMFFTSEEEVGELTFDDLDADTLRTIIEKVQEWERDNADLLTSAYVSRSFSAQHQGRDYTPHQAGIDLWFTENGHGAGFWDRGLGDIGDKLSEAAGRCEYYLYAGDDGKLYLSP